MSDDNACATLAAAIEKVGTGHLVVVTGAGVSLASGIPTFRGTDPGTASAWSCTGGTLAAPSPLCVYS